VGLARREPTLSLRDIDGSSRSCIARCVLISRLAECLAETERDSADNNLLAPIVGHVGDGNFHVGLITDVEDAEEVARVKAFLERLVESALAWTYPGPESAA
jgi:FAD/FMN-containing dehydrogenase